MIRCSHCQTHAGRFTKDLACCELRRLADAPEHVVFAEEARIAKGGFEKLQAFQAELDAERRRLAKIRQTRSQSLGNESLAKIKDLLG
jgi:hypothetical protein